jgi:hypothetical protein
MSEDEYNGSAYNDSEENSEKESSEKESVDKTDDEKNTIEHLHISPLSNPKYLHEMARFRSSLN